MKEPLSLEQKINKKSETFGDKITKWFDKIQFLELEGEAKQNVAMKVKQDAQPDKLYRIEIFLSSVIAALGLLQNSVAVVIGAMLIAPFLRPINGVSFSVARGEKPFFWISIRVLFFSVIISIIMGFISIKLTGLNNETSEILSRTSPNIIDLFIAIFSAMVAVLSLGFSRLGESVAGVAMAAALMPPLAVVGIELALGNYSLAWGSMMLFLANIVAMILVGAVTFWLYGFTPHNGTKQKSSVKTFVFIVIVILIISIPLVSSLLAIKEKRELETLSRVYLQNILSQETGKFSISSLELISIDNDKIKLSSTIKIPEGLDFYDTFKKQLDFELSKKLGKDVDLDIELIRIANIVSSEKTVSVETQIYDYVQNLLSYNYKDINILSLEVKDINDGYSVKAVIGVKDDFDFRDDTFSIIEQGLKNNFGEGVSLQIVPLTEYSKTSENELTQAQKLKEQIKTDFENYIDANLFEGVLLRNLIVQDGLDGNIVNINFDVDVSITDQFETFLNNLENYSNTYGNIELKVKLFAYKQLDFLDKQEDSLTGAIIE